MDRLNLNLLRTLVQILELRNITHAANELRLTQSAISRQLSQLREYFNDPLLVREGNEYLLTAHAQAIKPKLNALLNQVDNLRHHESFDPTLCQRKFTFACTDYVANCIFPDLIADIYQSAPQIDIRYKTWRSEWLGLLGVKPIDFAATMIDHVPDNLYGTHLGEDDPVIMVRKQHPMSGATLSDLDDWLRYPFVKITIGGDKDSFFDTELSRLHKRRRIAFEVPFYTSAFEVVAKTDFALLAPRHIAIKACEMYPLCLHDIPLEHIPRYNYYMLWHSIHQHDSAHRWLRERISNHIYNSVFSPHAMV